jgi:hypothetical protein
MWGAKPLLAGEATQERTHPVEGILPLGDTPVNRGATPLRGDFHHRVVIHRSRVHTRPRGGTHPRADFLLRERFRRRRDIHPKGAFPLITVTAAAMRDVNFSS